MATSYILYDLVITIAIYINTAKVIIVIYANKLIVTIASIKLMI